MANGVYRMLEFISLRPVQCLGRGVVCGDHVHVCMQSSSQVAPEEAIKTVQMVLAPSQGRPLPPVHLESVSLGLLLLPPQVCRIECIIDIILCWGWACWCVLPASHVLIVLGMA